jgi:hypothetical protein
VAVYVFFVFGLAVLAIVALAILKRARRPHGTTPGTYRAVKPLSDPEQTLYWRLKDAMPECVVLSQVTFSRFIRPEHAAPGSRQALFNRISRKSVDFLLCLPDFTVVSAVELDDRSHSSKRDAERDAILQAAGIPVVRVNVSAIPATEKLRALFTN